MEHRPLAISRSPPSSPLSELSRSPSLPPSSSPSMDALNRYPSPSSSATKYGSASPLKLSDDTEIQVRTDGSPSAKRRKVTERKPRTTEYLDMADRDEEGAAQLDRLITALRRKKKIVVIAGAGISVSAGIPDFRSSTGLFTTLGDKHKIKGGGKQLFDASVYRNDKSTAEFHNMVRDLSVLTEEAKPTKFHHMLATTASEGRLMRLYSQNVDCIDTSMPPLSTTVPLGMKGPWPRTIQLHGGLKKMQCTKCNEIKDFNSTLFNGCEAPLCGTCEIHDLVRTEHGGRRSHGIGRLRPRMVLYNEFNPDGEAIGAVSQADLRRVPDAVIVVGTSLKVPGVRRIVKEMCLATRAKRDGFTAWINLDPEPQGADMKNIFDLVVRGKCDDIAELVNLPHWNAFLEDIDLEETLVSGDSEKETKYDRGTSRDRINVLVKNKRIYDESSENESRASDLDIKSRLKEQVQEPTPSASPRQQSPLPARKPLPQGKIKQSTLVFDGKAPKVVQDTKVTKGTKTATTSKVTKTTKGKQPKKDAKLKNDLKKSLRTTRFTAVLEKTVGKSVKVEPVSKSPVWPASTKTPRRCVKQGLDSDSSALSLPPRDFEQLPPLRPSLELDDGFVYIKVSEKKETVKDVVFREEGQLLKHKLSNELNFHNTSSDIHSPRSRPRGMENLMD